MEDCNLGDNLTIVWVHKSRYKATFPKRGRRESKLSSKIKTSVIATLFLISRNLKESIFLGHLHFAANLKDWICRIWRGDLIAAHYPTPSDFVDQLVYFL